MADEMGASPIRDQSLLDAFAKQKGMCCIDDADDEPAHLQMQQHHELSVAVEYCVAQRPSKLGSLRGSSAKYESMYDSLAEVLADLQGEGAITVRKATPTEVNAADSAALRGMPVPLTPTRPQSANARLRSTGTPEDDSVPRMGSFEVLFTLYNRQSGQKYGPIQIHSKLQTRQWPLMQKLRQRLDVHLQQFLGKDVGHHQFYQARPSDRHSFSVPCKQLAGYVVVSARSNLLLSPPPASARSPLVFCAGQRAGF